MKAFAQALARLADYARNHAADVRIRPVPIDPDSTLPGELWEVEVFRHAGARARSIGEAVAEVDRILRVTRPALHAPTDRRCAYCRSTFTASGDRRVCYDCLIDPVSI